MPKRIFLLSALFSGLVCSCNSTGGEASKPTAVTSGDTSSTAIKTIYLSFDDGPLEGSEDINDAVNKENIKVTVFVVGQHAMKDDRMKGFYKLYQNNPLIEIGNHSYSHAHNQYEIFYKNPSSVLADFQKNQNELSIPNKIAREPGRNIWRLKDIRINDVNSGSVSADSLYKDGFKVFGWDIEWQHDGKTGVPIQTVDDMAALIEKRLDENKTVKKDNLVLLAHDEMFRNGWEESELKQLIQKLKEKGGYRFEQLSKYPG
ncbi:MAG: polysaccharide deacetylase family protein [Sphingobacteriales bacterium]|nr:polysaccharide deacetylase family protein [Sphingobacteriales bacterium]